MCCFSAFYGIPSVTQLCRPFLGVRSPPSSDWRRASPCPQGPGRWSLCLDLKTLDYHTVPTSQVWGREHPAPPGDPCALWACLVPVLQDTLFLLPFKAQLFQKSKTENKGALTQWKHITYQEQVPPCTSVSVPWCCVPRCEERAWPPQAPSLGPPTHPAALARPLA